MKICFDLELALWGMCVNLRVRIREMLSDKGLTNRTSSTIAQMLVSNPVWSATK